MRLETEAEIDAKIQRFASRLSSRAPESLARFIASLAVDTGIGTGSLCEHVRTFIVGDNLSEATDSLKMRINALRLSERRHPRCGASRDLGQRLCYIYEAVEAGATRAAALLTLAAKSLPSSEVIETMRRLVADNFWLRWPLVGIGASAPGK